MTSPLRYVSVVQANHIESRADAQAWGPLARAMRFHHPSIISVAKKHGRDAAQIFLRWGLQHVSCHTTW